MLGSCSATKKETEDELRKKRLAKAGEIREAEIGTDPQRHVHVIRRNLTV